MSSRHRKPAHRRFLSMEILEGRRLLVVGTVAPEPPPQNFANPEDTNYDGSLSPADALIVINALNDSGQSGSLKSFSTDVDGDGVVSPRDALLVINRLNSHSKTSSVPPQQRAIGLRKALDAGILPPKMSLSDAEEMLETLENGGHYEAGERYRNGQMLNIQQQPQDLGDPLAEGEIEGPASTEQTVDSTGESLSPELTSSQSVEENDPFDLFDSADEALSDPLHDTALWQVFLDATGTEIDDRLSIDLAERTVERLAAEDARDQLAQVIADSVQSGDKTVEQIMAEVAALRATLGDAHSQIAQLFANLDVEAIIEQFTVDLGTLAEALVAYDDVETAVYEPELTAFLSREYLDAMESILP